MAGPAALAVMRTIDDGAARTWATRSVDLGSATATLAATAGEVEPCAEEMALGLYLDVAGVLRRVRISVGTS
jgi:hypothetical protein